MIPLNYVFWLYVLLFGIIGAMRGWAKEMLVSFSAILALFIIVLAEKFLGKLEPDVQFWAQTLIIGLLAFFGYKSPSIKMLPAAQLSRKGLQSSLFGFVIGLINGYLIVGSIWFYLDKAAYEPLSVFIKPPPKDVKRMIDAMLKSMPPALLKGYGLYVMVAIAFVFLVVAFV